MIGSIFLVTFYTASISTPPWVAKYSYLAELIGLFLLFFFVIGITKRFFRKLKDPKSNAETSWPQHLAHAALPPTKLFLFLFFATILAEFAIRSLKIEAPFFNLLLLRKIGAIGCFAWFCLRWKSVFLKFPSSYRLTKKLASKPGAVQLIGKIFTLLILIISALTILQIFGLNIVPLLTFGSIGAAAFGFASKDVIANFYGGLVIYISHPFSVNDVIELPQKELLGTVEEIGWYFTTIRNLQKKPIYLPNSLFSTEYLINQSRMTHRRIEEKISVRFEDVSKISDIIAKIRNYLQQNPEIDANLPIQVYLQTFGPSSVDLECKAYTYATQYEAFMIVKQNALLHIYKLIYETNAAMPFPITEVIIRKENNF